jgi:hypothetical protein
MPPACPKELSLLTRYFNASPACLAAFQEVAGVGAEAVVPAATTTAALPLLAPLARRAAPPPSMVAAAAASARMSMLRHRPAPHQQQAQAAVHTQLSTFK